ncbi:hypothetical protein F4553_001783 [Allocatelliglobosispora scoriae]|uniref:Uncharacterized protein n=1 Tax=Allocatelliglobosispora scoriae TaxID=643052 RepID=A0A841BJH4_9ACTN|nr:hypothetical protein [Allocatelliglobosispora scoriae]MBB5868404.1 hypothetical protein [Allocatelliglobosispora scoriae]
MFHNAHRLLLAALSAWLLGSAASTVLVPYHVYIWLFAAVIIIPGVVVTWRERGPVDRAVPPILALTGLVPVLRWWSVPLLAVVGALYTYPWQPFSPRPLTYRKGWMVAALLAAIVSGIMTMFNGGLGTMVLALQGDRVHGLLSGTTENGELRRKGADVECHYARADGTVIPGSVPLIVGAECAAEVDLIADPRGVFDPVPVAGVDDSISEQGVLFGGTVVLCLIAAVPRRRELTPTGA